MPPHTNRAQRRQLKRDSSQYPDALIEVPRYDWPASLRDNPDAPLRVLRSNRFMVQEYAAPAPVVVRLSVHRTTLSGDRWTDGISWDELQELKAQAGYPFTWAVEIYPSVESEVNVANIRHLWLLPEPPAFAWNKHKATPAGSITP